MQSTIVLLCILLSIGRVSQAQLNYEGNPLTETIDYTAQESQSSKLNAKQYYQRFEFADGRKINFSKVSFKPSAIDPLKAAQETQHSSFGNDDDTAHEKQSNKSIGQTTTIVDNSHALKTNYSDHTQTASTFVSEQTRDDDEYSIDAFPKASIAKTSSESRAENRQLREYPIQSQQAGISVHSTITRQQFPQNPNSQDSSIALSQFLNSRTPEESQIALQKYLISQEGDSAISAQRSVGINNDRTKQGINGQGNVRDTFNNEISANYENQNFVEMMNNMRTLPATVSSDPTSQNAYLSRKRYEQQLRQQYPASRWNQMGIQSRRDGFYGNAPMKHHPIYRSPMRPRFNPYAQSRIAPAGPPIYHQKGNINAGPPGLISSGNNGHWKQQKPVELIYTKPPNSVSQNVLSNPNIPYEDAGKWFPNSDHPPPQKDIYYSQLYAQSYDPHYYNYIAKTGKIKPWLYGKLGKTEEQSIWSELFTGFKNHGMKNIMNPMFLLGMTIPTLTLVLSALMQKRSIGRSDNSAYDPRQLIQEYEPQILAAILNYENHLKERAEVDATNGKKVQKRSVDSISEDFHPQTALSPDLFEQMNLDKRKKSKIRKRTIGPAPPGLYPFEEYFLAHQAEFAAAILAHEKEQQDKWENDEKTENKVKKYQ